MVKFLKLAFAGVSIKFDANSPISRVLCSSSALIVAGAFGANAMNNSPLTKNDLLYICNEIEGHPDNVSPAIFGNLTASLVNNGTPYSVQYNIDSSLCFTAIVPNYYVSTEKARKSLPKNLCLAVAVFNTSHLSVLLQSFELGDEFFLSISLNDTFHEPYSKLLITHFDLL